MTNYSAAQDFETQWHGGTKTGDMFIINFNLGASVSLCSRGSKYLIISVLSKSNDYP